MSDHSQIIHCHECGVGLDTATQTYFSREVETGSYPGRSPLAHDAPITVYLCEYCADEAGMPPPLNVDEAL